MSALVWRRSLGAAATFLVSTVVVFIVTFALPGDPARTIAGRRAPSAETLTAIRRRYDLDAPLPVQYLGWMARLLRGDLGESYVQRRPVLDILREAAPVTGTLLAVTLVIELVAVLVIGTMAGRRRGRPMDAAVLLGCTAGLAVPTFVLASLAQSLLGVRWRLLPVAGIDAGLRSFLLPACTLAVPGVAVGVRLLRAEVITRSFDQHVVTARAKGIRDGAVTRRHLMRNALPPFATFVGLEIGALAGGSIVVERVFNLPGAGRAIATAISQRDNPVIIGFTMVVIAVYLLVDLLVDVAAMRLDPRLRTVD